MKRHRLLLPALGFIAALAIAIPLVVSNNTTERSDTFTTSAHQRRSEAQLSEKHRERIARRKARQEAYERFIDSTILSHNFRFIPTMFNVEPAGSTQIITNPAVEISYRGDWADINLPYYRGYVPPYRLAMINTVITQLTDFTTVQTDNGWTVTFDSWLYSANDYTFTLTVYSKSGGAQLELSSTAYPTTTYWGSIAAIY